MSHRKAELEGKQFLCRHLILARDSAWLEMVEDVKIQLLAQ